MYRVSNGMCGHEIADLSGDMIELKLYSGRDWLWYLAFDGSGKVVRDPHNHSMCTFTTGKRYHCDLSAS